MAVAEGADEHLIHRFQEELLKGFVGGVILFIKFSCVSVGEADVGDDGACGVDGYDGLDAWVWRGNKWDGRQCVIDGWPYGEKEEAQGAITEVRLDGRGVGI